MPAKVLMVQGTASSAGKSVLATALCRILREDGYSVAPFKGQNMALNAAVTPDGREIGRAQAVQAEAAGVEPTVDMNPILLKPEADHRVQVVVLGRPAGTLQARDFLTGRQHLWSVVAAALDRLRAAFDVVVIEGAGSPAEVNLRDGDLTNMRVARYARAPILLVGDIDRGGVFASLVGTLELVEPEDRALVAGLVINKFRGDLDLLRPGLDFLQRRTGKPVLGVLPYLRDLRIAAEDSATLDAERSSEAGAIEIAVIRLPHLANFDDFDLLAAEPGVRLRYVRRPDELKRPDLIVLPGSKATAADLAQILESGLAGRVVELARAGTPVLGICGGYQMLGRRIGDPEGIESNAIEVEGLGLLPVTTVFGGQKRTARVQARAASAGGPFGALMGTPVAGYEIHMGHTEVMGSPLLLVRREDGREEPDGCLDERGLVLGTYVHGLFESAAARHALLSWLASRRGIPFAGGRPGLSREAEYARLAAAVRAHLDLEAVYRVLSAEC